MIDRRSDLSYVDFVNEYIRLNKPVLLTNASKNWKAHEYFTPEFFKRNFPDKVAGIKGKQYKMKEYIDMMFASTEQNPAPYPWKLDIERKFPELLQYIQPGFEIMNKNRLKSPLFSDRFIPQSATLEIFFGGTSGWFPYIHYDLYGLYAIVTQVYGKKEFILYEPGSEKYLYPDANDPWKSTIKDYHNPDYEKYPLFKNAKGTSVVVNRGETVYIPKGCWHTARSIEPSISIAQDLLISQNWDLFTHDVIYYKKKESKLKGLIFSFYLKALEKCMSLHEKFISSY
ncbi:MAG: cupin-like domain-containing protein [Bacteroidia bacterium]